MYHNVVLGENTNLPTWKGIGSANRGTTTYKELEGYVQCLRVMLIGSRKGGSAPEIIPELQLLNLHDMLISLPAAKLNLLVN